MEVSLPTGTLCAERNAIGDALASDFGLVRRDIKRVAVLAVSLQASADGDGEERSSRDRSSRNPIAPCGACKEWLKKIAEVNPDFEVITFVDERLDQVYIHPVIP